MLPIKPSMKEAGITLVELTISLAIVSLIAVGGYQMMVRSQKFLAMKKTDQSIQTEISQLLSIIKKDWDYRVRVEEPDIPASGQVLLTATNTDCAFSLNPCPKLKMWIKRTINNTVINDVVRVENICRRSTNPAIVALVEGLNYAGKFNTACSTCPKGEIPAVKIEGLNMATGAVVLQSENRIFPQNLVSLDKVNPKGVIGMQACFFQAAADAPLSVEVRAVVLDQASTGLKLVKKTQVYPFENFASIRLEQ